MRFEYSRPPQRRESCRAQSARRIASRTSPGFEVRADGVSWSLLRYSQGSFLVAGYRRPGID